MMNKARGRILCVDNSRDTCELVTIMLGSAGYEASNALSVADGLRLAQSGSFDLILLDWYFEDGTGLELCQMIRAFDTNTPILFYSGVAIEAEIKKALRTGAQGFLVKPLGTENLLETVSRLVGKTHGEGHHVS